MSILCKILKSLRHSRGFCRTYHTTHIYRPTSTRKSAMPLRRGGTSLSGEGKKAAQGVKPLSIFYLKISFIDKTQNKFLKVFGQRRNFIVVFLVDMRHFRLPQTGRIPDNPKNHIMPSAGAVTNSYSNGRILPFINHKLTFKFPASKNIFSLFQSQRSVR